MEPEVTSNLSRRAALKTYVPPAITVVSLATTKAYGTSGARTKKTKSKGGKGGQNSKSGKNK